MTSDLFTSFMTSDRRLHSPALDRGTDAKENSLKQKCKKEAEEEGAMESEAAKKKIKEKENVQGKKAPKPIADSEQEEMENGVKNKMLNKEFPKYFQQTLAEERDAKERGKRDEEERLRREEKERLREEEHERLAEEKKCVKKEKKKEKVLKKKQEGKHMTARQKEEAHIVEARRNQVLANAGVLLPTGDTVSVPGKQPKYYGKKSKPQSKVAAGSTETREAQQEVEAEVEAPPSAPRLVVGQIFNSSVPIKSQNLGSIKITPEVEVIDKSERPKVCGGEEDSKSDPPPGECESKLRSPICCVLGHVDTGKTKLLDCIQGTNVQQGEAGGITQQIGATFFPSKNIRDRTAELKPDAKLYVPGLLVIDTPGHESFTNLRSRGSGLCDIAILVVDIMHGLEPQAVESLNLLKMRGTEFIIALNKVDRLYGWKTYHGAPIVKAMRQQSKDVQMEFNTRITQIITQFKEKGINTELYYKNRDMGETFSIVPTSAISGEGVPDLLLLLVQWTQKTMVEKLAYRNKVHCNVLEVKVVEGHGTTIDVILINGMLHEGDQIVVCGMKGPIVTKIRALLTPHPMKELRVKGTYLHHKEIKAAQGIKIAAQGLKHAIAGTDLYVVEPDDDLVDVKEAAMEDMRSVMKRIDKSNEGVYVQASTLGSLEALLDFLKTPAVRIPVSGMGIGPVHKKDVMKASVMLEKKKEYATILAFDVRVTPEARALAAETGVKIFCADIIYHLFDQFKLYIDNLNEEKEAAEDTTFPCVLKIIPNCVFNKKDPIILGVEILDGIAKVGTPICIPQRGFIDIGKITCIENHHNSVSSAKKGQRVAIKIVGCNPEEQEKMLGTHFDVENELVSRISRKSIDMLKANHRAEMSSDDWRLIAKLKHLFKMQ